jgi:hypothetical protein
MSYVGVSIGSDQLTNLKFIDTGQFPIVLLGSSVFMLRYWQLGVGTDQIGYEFPPFFTFDSAEVKIENLFQVDPPHEGFWVE